MEPTPVLGRCDRQGVSLIDRHSFTEFRVRVKVRFRYSFTEVRVRVRVRFRYSFTEVRVRVRFRYSSKISRLPGSQSRHLGGVTWWVP